MKKHLLASLLLSSTLSSKALFADDYTADSKVDTATVYRNGGALIGRTAAFEIPAGTHAIRFPNIPLNARAEFSPFINVLKGSAHIHSVRFEETYTSGTTSEAQKQIQNKIDALQKQVAEEHQNIRTKELQMSFLRSLGSGAPQQATSLSISEWQNAFNFIGEKGESLLKEIEKSNSNIKDLGGEINALYRELNDSGNSQEDTLTGIATIEASEAQTLELALNYFMKNARWELQINSSLDTKNDQITVTDKALISQQTGENWQDIKLSLSNTHNLGDFGSIEQTPEFLGFMPERQILVSAPRQEFLRTKAMDSEEIVVSGVRISSNNSMFDRSYNIEGSYSQDSSTDSEEILISSNDAAANTVLRALPRTDRTAYVFAQTRFKDLETQRNIEASLYRDGHFIGKDRWPDLLKDQPLNLPFGADNQIDISYVQQAPQDDKKGVFSKSNVEEKRILISVKNQHTTAQTIEIFDRMPVSGHKDIKVTTIKGATKPTETDVNGQQGILMWRKTLEPGELWQIKHQYQITYPSDQVLQRR